MSALEMIMHGHYRKARRILFRLLASHPNGFARAYELTYLYLASEGAGLDPGSTVKPHLLHHADPLWPMPVLLDLMGRICQKALLESVLKGNAPERLCEATYYLGFQAKLRGHRRLALRYFRASLQTAVVGYAEYMGAALALRQLTSPRLPPPHKPNPP